MSKRSMTRIRARHRHRRHVHRHRRLRPARARVSFSHKELTTPDAPHRGVMTGIRKLFDAQGIACRDVARVVHATTLFTNALIERKGAPTGLITTDGLSRHAGDAPRAQVRALRSVHRAAAAAGAPQPAARSAGAHRTPTAASSTPLDERRCSRACASLIAAGRGIARDRVPARLRQPGARAARARGDRARASRSSSCRSRRTSRRRSASTSAPRPPSSTPTSSRSPKAISSC